MELGNICNTFLVRWGLYCIKWVKQATQRLASGDYSIQLQSSSEDELGILTAEFGDMAEKLKGFHDLNISKTLAEQQKSGAILANIQQGIFFVGRTSAYWTPTRRH